MWCNTDMHTLQTHFQHPTSQHISWYHITLHTLHHVTSLNETYTLLRMHTFQKFMNVHTYTRMNHVTSHYTTLHFSHTYILTSHTCIHTHTLRHLTLHENSARHTKLYSYIHYMHFHTAAHSLQHATSPYVTVHYLTLNTYMHSIKIFVHAYTHTLICITFETFEFASITRDHIQYIHTWNHTYTHASLYSTVHIKMTSVQKYVHHILTCMNTYITLLRITLHCITSHGSCIHTYLTYFTHIHTLIHSSTLHAIPYTWTVVRTHMRSYI